MKNMDPFELTITDFVNKINNVDFDIRSIYSNLAWVNEYLDSNSTKYSLNDNQYNMWQARKATYLSQIRFKFELYTNLVSSFKALAENDEYKSVLMRMRLRDELDACILSLIG